jgi:hypothetical protein
MAGPAEAAVFYGLLMIAAVLSLSGGLLALAWRKRWPIAAGVAVFACLLIGLVFQPWHSFAPATSSDPDELFWRLWLRIVSVLWALMLLGSLTSFGLLTRQRRLASRALKAG